MTDKLIEQVAHVLCETGAAASWVHAVQSARHLLPIIKAERIRGGEMVKEAAAGTVCGLVAKHATDAAIADVADQLGQVIRALSVPAIVEAGEHQPKENSDASSD